MIYQCWFAIPWPVALWRKVCIHLSLVSFWYFEIVWGYSKCDICIVWWGEKVAGSTLFHSGDSEVVVPLAACDVNIRPGAEIVNADENATGPSCVLYGLNNDPGVKVTPDDVCSSKQDANLLFVTTLLKECGHVGQLGDNLSGIAVPAQTQWSSLFKSLPRMLESILLGHSNRMW